MQPLKLLPETLAFYQRAGPLPLPFPIQLHMNVVGKAGEHGPSTPPFM